MVCDSSGGIIVQCSGKRCPRTFHPYCAAATTHCKNPPSRYYQCRSCAKSVIAGAAVLDVGTAKKKSKLSTKWITANAVNKTKKSKKEESAIDLSAEGANDLSAEESAIDLSAKESAMAVASSSFSSSSYVSDGGEDDVDSERDDGEKSSVSSSAEE